MKHLILCLSFALVAATLFATVEDPGTLIRVEAYPTRAAEQALLGEIEDAMRDIYAGSQGETSGAALSGYSALCFLHDLVTAHEVQLWSHDGREFYIDPVGNRTEPYDILTLAVVFLTPYAYNDECAASYYNALRERLSLYRAVGPA